MRYVCHFCAKSVSSSLPDDSVIRAIMICPECIELTIPTGSFNHLADDITAGIISRKKEKESK